MVTFFWGIGVGIYAIWGVFDWRIALTGVIVTVIFDAIVFLNMANDATPREDDGW